MRKVEATIEIDVKPEIAIRAFTDFDKLKGWWEVERAFIEKKEGGAYVLAWQVSDTGFRYVSTGIISRYIPGALIEIGNLVYLNPEKPLLGSMTLTIKATPMNGKTSLYLCQDGYQTGPDWDWYYEAVKKAWPMVLVMLKNYLEKE